MLEQGKKPKMNGLPPLVSDRVASFQSALSSLNRIKASIVEIEPTLEKTMETPVVPGRVFEAPPTEPLPIEDNQFLFLLEQATRVGVDIIQACENDHVIHIQRTGATTILEVSETYFQNAVDIQQGQIISL